MMFVEVKSFGSHMSIAQKDTLSLLNQVLRNRTKNKHADRHGRHAANHVPMAKAYSHAIKKDIRLKLFGGHLLQMETDDPEIGNLQWDFKDIGLDTLISLLRFEIDPDTMNEIDWRRRYNDFEELNRQKKLW